MNLNPSAMTRIFTFGCSFTSYIWPGWAEILDVANSFVVENWGSSGFGNEFISKSVVECNAVNRFTPDDVVIIVWSEHLRFDVMQENYIWFQNRMHDNIIWNEHSGYFKSITNILLTISYLKHLGVKLYMSSIVPLDLNEREVFHDNMINSLYEKNPELLMFEGFNNGNEWLPSFEGGVFPYFHDSKETYKIFINDPTLTPIHKKEVIVDRHFLPNNQFKWLTESTLLDKLNVSRSDKNLMKDAASTWHNEVLQLESFSEILHKYKGIKSKANGITRTN